MQYTPTWLGWDLTFSLPLEPNNEYFLLGDRQNYASYITALAILNRLLKPWLLLLLTDTFGTLHTFLRFLFDSGYP